MIDRVSINRLINQALEAENRVRRREEVQRVEENRQRTEDIVEISPQARQALRMEDEEFSERVNRIREEIASGRYEVNVDRIMEGLRRFFG